MNKKTTFSKNLLLLGALALSGNLMAQDAVNTSNNNPQPFTKASTYRTWSFGVNGGVLSPVVVTGGKNDFTNWKGSAGYGGYLKKQLWHNFGLQGDFFRGTLTADNGEPLGNGAALASPHSSFETEIKFAGSLSGVFNFGNFSILNRQSFFSPYISAGAGLMGYQPVLTSTNNTVSDYNKGENIHELYIPIGVGAKFMISKGVNIDLGYKMNFVDGDNLDGYHAGPQNDKFSYAFAGLEFALGSKAKPQLAFANPAAILENNYIAKYDDLKSQMDAMKNDNQALTDINNKLNQLMNDADGDGVSDFYDKCPETPTNVKVDGSGCPLPKVEATKPVTYIITEEDKKVVNDAIKNLEFDLAKSTIRPTSYTSLNRVAELIVTKNLSLKLAGHTDSQGSDAYNMKLSKDRAESVKAYLVSKGANPSRIEATGYGETQPIESNNTEQGRQNNRRVEFTLFN